MFVILDIELGEFLRSHTKTSSLRRWSDYSHAAAYLSWISLPIKVNPRYEIVEIPDE